MGVKQYGQARVDAFFKACEPDLPAKGKAEGLAVDLGCGPGRHSIWLAKLGFDVMAIDNNSEYVDALTKTAALDKLSITVKQDSLISTHLGEGRYNVAVCSFVLHYFRLEEAKALIGRIVSSLVPGGLLLVVGFGGQGQFRDLVELPRNLWLEPEDHTTLFRGLTLVKPYARTGYVETRGIKYYQPVFGFFLRR